MLQDLSAKYSWERNLQLLLYFSKFQILPMYHMPLLSLKKILTSTTHWSRKESGFWSWKQLTSYNLVASMMYYFFLWWKCTFWKHLKHMHDKLVSYNLPNIYFAFISSWPILNNYGKEHWLHHRCFLIKWIKGDTAANDFLFVLCVCYL